MREDVGAVLGRPVRVDIVPRKGAHARRVQQRREWLSARGGHAELLRKAVRYQGGILDGVAHDAAEEGGGASGAGRAGGRSSGLIT